MDLDPCEDGVYWMLTYNIHILNYFYPYYLYHYNKKEKAVLISRGGSGGFPFFA